MSFNKTHRSIDCDGGGYKGCGNYIALLRGETATSARKDAKNLEGWQRVRCDDGSYIDLCAEHRISTRRKSGESA